jgi:predicted Zn-dependent protease with MMP-like domain
MRGPGVLPGPLTPRGVPGLRSRREVFDEVVLAAVRRLEERWHDQLGLIEFGVEETPLVPDGWSEEAVPLASLVRGSGATPTRLVLFRRPIELRTESRTDLHVLVFTVLVEQVSELLGLSPEEIDPGYEAD